MNLIAVNIDSIRLGHPLPFALLNERGVLLAHKGYVITERAEISYWTSRGMTLTTTTAPMSASCMNWCAPTGRWPTS